MHRKMSKNCFIYAFQDPQYTFDIVHVTQEPHLINSSGLSSVLVSLLSQDKVWVFIQFSIMECCWVDWRMRSDSSSTAPRRCKSTYPNKNTMFFPTSKVANVCWAHICTCTVHIQFNYGASTDVKLHTYCSIYFIFCASIFLCFWYTLSFLRLDLSIAALSQISPFPRTIQYHSL